MCCCGNNHDRQSSQALVNVVGLAILLGFIVWLTNKFDLFGDQKREVERQGRAVPTSVGFP